MLIKARLCVGALLRSPDWHRQFWIMCDSSEVGYGAVLAQMDDDDLPNTHAELDTLKSRGAWEGGEERKKVELVIFLAIAGRILSLAKGTVN